jgi:CSLREA domain-containing protein
VFQGRKGSRLVVLAAFACALLAPTSALAEDITAGEPTDEYGTGAGCSLREAVQTANTDTNFGGCTQVGGATEADNILLTQATYVLTRDAMADAGPDNSTADLDVVTDPLSLEGFNSSGPSTIDGDSEDVDAGTVDDRVIEVHPSVADGPAEDFGFSGLIIRDGATTGAGGGLLINGPPGAGEDFSIGIGLATFTGNTAGSGGAIENSQSAGAIDDDMLADVRISDSTISGNSATGSGGGLTTTGPGVPTTRLENVTITNNTADSNSAGGGDGGGLATVLDSAAIVLQNTILAGNNDASPSGTVAPDCNEFGGGIGSVTNNLIGNGINCDYDGDVSDIVGVPPGLAGLALIPGAGLSTVLAHDLLPGSPARDTGNPEPIDSVPESCGPLAQNFGPRPIDGNGDGVARCDIGSVEADPVPPAGSATAPLTSATPPKTV